MAPRSLLAWLAACGVGACAFPDYAVEQDATSLLARICGDGVASDAETGVDCGGACPPCKENQPCKVANDCLTLACVQGVCLAARCDDHIANGSESDRDCGGQCERRCDAGAACGVNADCVSGVCGGGSCQTPACTDLVRNGDESGIDCGGTCPACPSGGSCQVEGDCMSHECAQGLCVAAQCTDGAMNGEETSVDCGGPQCAPCGPNATCVKPTDCSSLSCDDTRHCSQSQCQDRIRNGGETDVDCGGGMCPGCPELGACLTSSDCASGACQSGRCVPAAPSGEELSQAGWSGSASSNFNTDKPADALDGDASTIWSNGAYQEPGMFFQVDLGGLRAFYSIEFECSIKSDVPAGMDVYLWQSGDPSSPVRTNVAGFPRTTIEFATPQVARYIRLVIAQKTNLWWCIDELRVRK